MNTYRWTDDDIPHPIELWVDRWAAVPDRAMRNHPIVALTVAPLAVPAFILWQAPTAPDTMTPVMTAALALIGWAATITAIISRTSWGPMPAAEWHARRGGQPYPIPGDVREVVES